VGKAKAEISIYIAKGYKNYFTRGNVMLWMRIYVPRWKTHTVSRAMRIKSSRVTSVELAIFTAVDAYGVQLAFFLRDCALSNQNATVQKYIANKRPINRWSAHRDVLSSCHVVPQLQTSQL